MRFALVGGTTTLLYGVVAVLLISHMEISSVPGSILAYLVVIPVNFLLQRAFAFNSSNRIRGDLARYALVHCSNIAATGGIMHLVSVLGLDYRVGIVATMVFVPIIVFVVLDRWVFASRGRT